MESEQSESGLFEILIYTTEKNKSKEKIRPAPYEEAGLE
jgi:hypothetical protein